MSINCDVNVFFANLHSSGNRIPDARPIKLKFSLTITFSLSKTENRTKKSQAQLSY